MIRKVVIDADTKIDAAAEIVAASLCGDVIKIAKDGTSSTSGLGWVIY